MNRAFPSALCLVVLAASVLAANAAVSSTDVASLGECQGPVSSWRENELTEGGTLAGFLEAATDHQAWLDGKGLAVQVVTWTAFEPVPEEERPGQRVAFGSEVVYPSFAALEEVMSTREADRDDAYEAFVQKYQANTTIKTYRLVCSSD